MEKVSVIFCTKDRADIFKDSLRAVLTQKVKPDEIIVVDKSKDDSVKSIVDKFKRRYKKIKFRFIKQKGRGLTNARNIGIKAARGDIICFLDDDTVVFKNWLKEILRTFKDYNADAVCGVEVRFYNRLKLKESKLLRSLVRLYNQIFGISGVFLFIGGVGDVLPSGFAAPNFLGIKKVMPVKMLSGHNMCYKRYVIDAVGKFNEKLIGNCYLEDIEYSYRAYKKGFKLFVNPRAKVDHKFTEVSRDSLPKLKYYFLYNRRIFFYDAVYDGRLTTLLRYYWAWLGMFFQFFAYSFVSCDFRFMKAYFYALFGKSSWK